MSKRIGVILTSLAALSSAVVAIICIIEGPLVNQCIGAFNLFLASQLAKIAYEIATGRRIPRQ